MVGLDPNDFVDTDEVFDDEYNGQNDDGRITYAEFTIVPGSEVSHASLVYHDDGVSFLGGSTGANWAISLYYGYRYNGQDLPISDKAARHVLEKLGDSGRDLSATDWTAYDWTSFG